VLGLHANTVRPHLERMRDVGLLDVETDPTGTVGRPQHRYFLASGAPSLGLEPPAFPLLARLLAAMAAAARLEPDDAATAARDTGQAMAAERLRRTPGDSCVAALADALDELGFDPAVASGDGAATIAFTHCPFAELAEAYPELVCHLHRGLVEGFVAAWADGGVDRFSTLADRDPCQVELSLR
jgi:predicted ArsR family transcriptional regulator